MASRPSGSRVAVTAVSSSRTRSRSSARSAAGPCTTASTVMPVRSSFGRSRSAARWVAGRASSQTLCQMPEEGEADAVVVVAGHAALLAVGDVPLVGGGVDPHRELVFAVAEGVGDVGGEGGVAALVVGDLGAVHPDRGGVVHGAEVQHDALSGPVGGHGERAPVPGGPEPVLGDAGGGRLPGEGHGDGAVVAVGRVGGVRLGGVGAEVPGAVEGEPGVGPVEVRAGVFGTGVVMGVCAPIRCGCGAVGGVRGKLSP